MGWHFDGVLFKILWNGLHKREVASKVLSPEVLINEDNYSDGIYLLYSNKIVCIKDNLYFYRDNNGLSKKVMDRSCLI